VALKPGVMIGQHQEFEDLHMHLDWYIKQNSAFGMPTKKK
jgi:hypothetical protein